MATWKVVQWSDKPERTRWVPLQCACGRDADCEVADVPGVLIIAAIGMGLVFDPPSFPPPANFMPEELQCRKCGRVYSSEPAVEQAA